MRRRAQSHCAGSDPPSGNETFERTGSRERQVPVAPDVCDLYVALGGKDDPALARAAFSIANEARRAGLGAQMELAGRSLKGQLKQAGRIGARYVAIVEDPERVSLRDMDSGEQKEMQRHATVAAVLRGDRL